MPFKTLTQEVRSLGLLVGRLCSEGNNTTFINHLVAFIVYDFAPARYFQKLAFRPVPPASARCPSAAGDGWVSSPKATCTLGPGTKYVLPPSASRRWLVSYFVLLGWAWWWWWLEGERSHSNLKTAPYIHDDTLPPRAAGREQSHKSTHLGLTVGDPVMHHVYGLTNTGVGFSCPCYALINTHAHASRKATWWMCACSRGCLRGAAADRCRCSLWKTLLTNGVSAIHQTDYQPSSSSPQPSHVCPRAPNSCPKIEFTEQ